MTITALVSRVELRGNAKVRNAFISDLEEITQFQTNQTKCLNKGRVCGSLWLSHHKDAHVDKSLSHVHVRRVPPRFGIRIVVFEMCS